MPKKSLKICFPMPTAKKKGFQVLNLHPNKLVFKEKNLRYFYLGVLNRKFRSLSNPKKLYFILMSSKRSAGCASL